MSSRRKFLVSSTAASIAVTFSSISFGTSSNAARQIALLSDTHIPADAMNEYRGFFPVKNLKKAVEEILQSEASFALLCGDAARLEGKPDDYAQLKELLSPITSKMRMEIALGNHDDRANFLKVFEGDKSSPLAGKKHVSVVDFGVQRWILLDSLMFVDKVPGLLGQEQRQWLDDYLSKNSGLPIVLMVHHTLGDRDGDLLDADKLLSIAKKHSDVKAIIFGHSHVWSQEKIDGLWHINLPAVGYNFAEEQPIGWVLASIEPNQIVLELHAIGGNKKDVGNRHVISFA